MGRNRGRTVMEGRRRNRSPSQELDADLYIDDSELTQVSEGVQFDDEEMRKLQEEMDELEKKSKMKRERRLSRSSKKSTIATILVESHKHQTPSPKSGNMTNAEKKESMNDETVDGIGNDNCRGKDQNGVKSETIFKERPGSDNLISEPKRYRLDDADGQVKYSVSFDYNLTADKGQKWAVVRFENHKARKDKRIVEFPLRYYKFFSNAFKLAEQSEEIVAFGAKM